MSLTGETICVGIDVGSTASKAVVLRNNEIVGSYIGQSTLNPTQKARQVFDMAMGEAGLEENQVGYIVGTGYGRSKIRFANENVSEITCHARGAHFILPEVRTIIDVGGQDSKAISLASNGTVLEFVMNDKCAAGTGRFLEFMARSMDLDIPEMAALHREEAIPAVISSMCSVFAESEIRASVRSAFLSGMFKTGYH